MPADIIGTNMIIEDARRHSGCSSSSTGRSSRRSASPTKSTAPRRRRSRPCSKRCRRSASPSPATCIKLKQPFFVLATQNPIEQEGTYPLPEAQLDRFFFKLVVGYSSREELNTIIDRTTRASIVEPEKVMDGAEIVELAAAGPRSDRRPARAGLRRPADAGHAPRAAVRAADHEPVSALGRQPARGADADPGGEGPGAARAAATTSASRTCGAFTCRRCGTA